MAPNLVTLSGLGFIVINLLVTLAYDPSLDKELPRWVYFFNAFGLFMYQTFDGCDGIHARRIGQSSPLGELFDHSVDSINTTLSLYIFCSTIGTGYTFRLIFSQFALLANFYLSTWEEYHTHVLYLSEFSGPVEGILMVCFAFILTGILGPQVVWHSTVCTIEYNYKSYVVDTSDIVVVFFTLGLIANCISARRNVVECYWRDKNTVDPRKSILNALKGLIPFISYMAVTILLVIVEPRFISIPFTLSVGLTTSFVVGRIIVNHLTRQSFPYVNLPMALPVVQLVLYKIIVFYCGNSGDISSIVSSLSWAGFGITLGIHGMFINEVTFEFTRYLDVYVLTIKHPKFV